MFGITNFIADYYRQRKEIKQQTKSINFLVIKLQQQDDEIEDLNNTIKQSFDLTDKLNEFERENKKLYDRNKFLEHQQEQYIQSIQDDFGWDLMQSINDALTKQNKSLETNNRKQAQKIKELTAGLERLTVSKQQVITDFITRNIAGAKALKDVNRVHVELDTNTANHLHKNAHPRSPILLKAMAISNDIPQITEDAKKNLFCDNLTKAKVFVDECQELINKGKIPQTHVNFKSNYPYLQRRFDNINYLFADHKLNPSDEIIDYTALKHFDKGEHMSNNRIEYLNYFIRVEKTNGKCCFVACHETGIKNIVTGFFDSKSWAINNLDKLIKHIESITPPMKGQ